MIKIANLTLTISHPNTLYITNKQLKLTAGLCTYATKSIGKLLSEGNIKWDDNVVLPFHPLINFEIVTKHKFGYNPEQLEGVIQGSFALSQKNVQSNVKTIMTSVTNLQGEKVGFLKADVRSTSKRGSIFNSSHILQQSPKNSNPVNASSSLQVESQMANLQQVVAQKQSLKIASIIAHVDDIAGKKIWFTFKSGVNQIQTEEYTSKSGQVLFLGDYELKKDSYSTQLNVEVQQNSLGASKVLGKACILINEQGKANKKVEITNEMGRNIGEMFVDCKITNKNDRKKEYFTRQSKLQTSYIQDDSSLLDPHNSSSAAKKKLSVVNSNNQIRFSKEKRFFGMLHDKKSDYISYQSGGSFEFKETNANRYYRGASIGRGSKVDFIKEIKAHPGVGEYKLPSIWDRY